MLAKNVDLRNKAVLVTGAAGFIGANLVLELLRHVDGIKIRHYIRMCGELTLLIPYSY